MLPDARHPPVYMDAVTVTVSSTGNSTGNNTSAQGKNNGKINSASGDLHLRWLWLLASLVALVGLMFI